MSRNIFSRTLALSLTPELSLVRAHDLARALALELARTLALALDRDLNSKLQQKLQQLREQLPDASQENREKFWGWWQNNGQAWTLHLRTVITEHRNIGHDWQFSDRQKQLLQQYYTANLLLVDCLNSDCYVSREVRQEIEEMLLLPMADIEKRHQ